MLCCFIDYRDNTNVLVYELEWAGIGDIRLLDGKHYNRPSLNHPITAIVITIWSKYHHQRLQENATSEIAMSNISPIVSKSTWID